MAQSQSKILLWLLQSDGIQEAEDPGGPAMTKSIHPDDLPDECRTDGSWCGAYLMKSGLCLISRNKGCLLLRRWFRRMMGAGA